MKKMVYDEAEIKRFTAPMEEPMRHQIQDAMNLKIPKEYIQILVNKKFNFYSRAYLVIPHFIYIQIMLYSVELKAA